MAKSSDIPARMESAKALGGGVMEMWVLFDTEAEVKEATTWLKGRQKVKNLTPMTTDEAERRCAVRHKEIAAHYGIKS